jgi:hypothetical protein
MAATCAHAHGANICVYKLRDVFAASKLMQARLLDILTQGKAEVQHLRVCMRRKHVCTRTESTNCVQAAAKLICRHGCLNIHKHMYTTDSTGQQA